MMHILASHKGSEKWKRVIMLKCQMILAMVAAKYEIIKNLKNKKKSKNIVNGQNCMQSMI